MKPTIQEQLKALWEDYWTGSEYHNGVRDGIKHAQKLIDLGLTPLATAEHLFWEANAVEAVRGERFSKGYLIEGRIVGMRKAAYLIQG